MKIHDLFWHIKLSPLFLRVHCNVHYHLKDLHVRFVSVIHSHHLELRANVFAELGILVLLLLPLSDSVERIEQRC